MKIFDHRGVAVHVLFRDEHCPPHVHVFGNQWGGRYQFSFVDNVVELWDLEGKHPKAPFLEDIRQQIRSAGNLLQIRHLWSTALGHLKLCLLNKAWDDGRDRVIAVPASKKAVRILDATFRATNNTTVLSLSGPPHQVEIQL